MDMEEMIDLRNLDSHHVCTYKIEAHTGAPGFNYYQNFGGQKYEDERLIVSWIEYDLHNVAMDLDFGPWPVPTTQIYHLECGSNCAQGSLAPRAVIDDEGNSMQYDSERILNDMSEHIHEVNLFNTRVSNIRDINANLPDDADQLPLPPTPEDYDGYTFEMSSNLGGFGHPTAGMYHVDDRTWSGYKPFGANGQGERDDLSVSMDHHHVDRVMLVTVNPQATRLETTTSADLDSYDITDYAGEPGWRQTNETVSLKVGQYAFRHDLDFMPPSEQTVMQVGDAAQRLMAIAVAAPMVALSLF